MKVLTIRQPWASLIVNGYKKYEFRSWKTNYRGKILIHAGLNIEKDMLNRFKDYHMDYPKGAIIGEASLVDCILVDNEFNETLKKIDPIVYGKSNHTETYAWKLENVKIYDQIIDVKGKLGLWNYSVTNEKMIHQMKLHNGPFSRIKNGNKTIEMRLNDEKRQLIKIGDIIEFQNRITLEVISVEVVNLYKFDSFKELYNSFDKISIGYVEDEEADFKDMEQYYSIDDQKKYGVIAIEIKLI